MKYFIEPWINFFKYGSQYKTDRKSFWIAWFLNSALFMTISISLLILGGMQPWVAFFIFSLFILFFLAYLPMFIRRIRDAGYSPLWILFIFFPIISVLNMEYGWNKFLGLFSYGYLVVFCICLYPSKYDNNGEIRVISKKEKFITAILIGLFIGGTKLLGIISMSLLTSNTLVYPHANIADTAKTTDTSEQEKAIKYLAEANKAMEQNKIEKAYRLYKQSCDLGRLDACLAQALIDINKEKPTNPEEDFELFTKACVVGNYSYDKDACVYLGFMYENGIGVKKNIQKAYEIYKQSCDLKSGLGCNNLGILLIEGTHPIKPNTKKGMELLKKACNEYNYQEACQNLGE